MKNIKIFVDSASDLPKDIAAKHDITVLPLYVTLGETTYLDDGQLTCGDLFDFVDKNDMLPKTAAVNMADFAKAFKPVLEAGDDALVFTISSDLSSTPQNAFNAINELGASDRIFLVDTRSLSSGIGLAALKACDLRSQGLSAAEIKRKMDAEIVPNISASFFVPLLDYLYKGGRCSRLSAYFGSKLKLSPQLVLIDGKIVPGEKFRGSWNKVCDDYLEVTLKDGSGIDKTRVFITHTAFDQAEKRAEIAKMLKEKFGFKQVIDNFAGATISSHCGPGTLGVLFIKE